MPLRNQFNSEDEWLKHMRMYFAAASITSVISVCSTDTKKDGESIAELFARKAFEIADAMLAAR